MAERNHSVCIQVTKDGSHKTAPNFGKANVPFNGSLAQCLHEVSRERRRKKINTPRRPFKSHLSLSLPRRFRDNHSRGMLRPPYTSPPFPHTHVSLRATMPRVFAHTHTHPKPGKGRRRRVIDDGLTHPPVTRREKAEALLEQADAHETASAKRTRKLTELLRSDSIVFSA